MGVIKCNLCLYATNEKDKIASHLSKRNELVRKTDLYCVYRPPTFASQNELTTHLYAKIRHRLKSKNRKYRRNTDRYNTDK